MHYAQPCFIHNYKQTKERKVKKMKYCTKCGAPLDPGAKFCTKCGSVVENTSNVKKIEIPKMQHNKTTSDFMANPKNKITAIAVGAVIVVIIAGTVLFQSVIKPNMDRSSDYKQAIAYAGSGNYEQAASIFAYLGDYKDSDQKWAESKLEQAQELTKSDFDFDTNFSDAKTILAEVEAKQDVLTDDGKRKLTNLKKQCQNYESVVEYINNGNYSDARTLLQQMDS